MILTWELEGVMHSNIKNDSHVSVMIFLNSISLPIEIVGKELILFSAHRTANRSNREVFILGLARLLGIKALEHFLGERECL